jgi:hypothetical protein
MTLTPSQVPMAVVMVKIQACRENCGMPVNMAARLQPWPVGAESGDDAAGEALEHPSFQPRRPPFEVAHDEGGGERSGEHAEDDPPVAAVDR